MAALQPGTTEVSEVDSEEDPGRNYMRCKPMASLFLAAAAAREVEQGPEGAPAEVSPPAESLPNFVS